MVEFNYFFQYPNNQLWYNYSLWVYIKLCFFIKIRIEYIFSESRRIELAVAFKECGDRLKSRYII